jgi:tartrate dehydrogenase/decarboxylase/D-malate dehydrogenase
MMLDHLGETAAAARLMIAIEHVTRTAELPADLGGTATTAQITSAVCAALSQAS